MSRARKPPAAADPPLNDSEWKVMRALWRLGRGGVADVHGALQLETSWAYSTVKTLLERLEEKGAVRAEAGRAGREFVAVLQERQARVTAVQALLDRAFEGTFGALVRHLVEERKLSRREREELRAAIEELRREGRGRKGRD